LRGGSDDNGRTAGQSDDTDPGRESGVPGLAPGVSDRPARARRHSHSRRPGVQLLVRRDPGVVRRDGRHSPACRDRADRTVALRQAALWDEVKDRLHTPGTGLSGGQQQRLCIARALANEPEVLLLDEPCSALDPGATQRIEELLVELKQSYSILIVTHNMQQASRASDFTGFFYLGRLIEFGQTKQIFTRPADERTEAYITGRFG